MATATTRKRAAKKAVPAKKAAARKVADVEEDLLEEEEIATTDKKVVVYEAERLTPGTMRYKEIYEDGELPVTNVLYVKKTAYRELGEPETIRVTIEPHNV